MRNPRSVKLEFLGKWMKGVGKCRCVKRKMNLLERKKVIKVSADIAMASTRKGRRCWSRALIANTWREHTTKLLTEHIIGSLHCHTLTKPLTSSSSSSSCSSQSLRRIHRIRSSKMKRKMLKLKLKRRSRSIRSRRREAEKELIRPTPCKVMTSTISDDSIAIASRTRMLKRLVPGGELMDDASLVEETLDYIQSLRVQVEVMRSLLTTSHLIKHS